MRQKKLFNAVVIILHEAFTVPPLNPFYGYPVFSPLALSYFFASHSYSTHISVQALGIAAFITDSNDFVSLALVFVRIAKPTKHIQNCCRYFVLCQGFN
jgi:hypothetical protein